MNHPHRLPSFDDEPVFYRYADGCTVERIPGNPLAWVYTPFDEQPAERFETMEGLSRLPIVQDGVFR